MMLARLVVFAVVAMACARVIPTHDTAPPLPPLAVITFDSAWALIHATHFDSTYGGRNWAGVGAALRPQAASATTPQALRAVIQRMLDTLGESHGRVLAREDVQASTSAAALADPGIDVRPTARGMLIARVDPGSPAAAAGIRPGWMLQAIDGQSVTASTRRAVGARFKGDSGTAVSVLLHDLSGHVRELSLNRTVPVGILAVSPNLPPRVVRFRVATLASPAHGPIGLLQFDQWLLQVAAALDSAIHKLRDARGLVIDLRGNGGGLGSMVAGFAGYFVDTSTVVGTVRTRHSVLHLIAHPRVAVQSEVGAEPFGGPLAILVDRFTGSASEVFASGMQSAGRARVFGDTTAGAVLASALDRLPNGDVLQHPVADFVTLTGVRLEGRGVRPDEVLIPTTNEYANDEDPVLSAAARWIRGQAHDSTMRGQTMNAALTTLLATAMSLPGQAPQPADSLNPAQVIAAYVAAIGGEEAVRSVAFRHMVAELAMPAQAIRGSLESYAVAPNMLLIRTTLPGFGSSETVYNGTIGWSVSEVAGATLLSGRQLDQLRASADLLMPLHANVRSMASLGLRDFEGRKSIAIAIVSDSGDAYTEFYDIESHLLVGMDHRIATPGGDVPTTTIIGDYRRFGDLLVPTTITQRLPGGQVMVTRIVSIDQRPIDHGLFVPPESVRRLIK